MVYDLAETPTLLCEKESVLKFSLRSIAAFSEGNGYVVGSIEGRVGVEYISSSEQEKPFSFRCHRKTDAFNELCYPVNSICVHPLYGQALRSTRRYRTFATGGADGSVCIWDAAAKKRLAIFQEWASAGDVLSSYSPGVASLAFNRDGTKLAIACSYTFEQGPSLL